MIAAGILLPPLGLHLAVARQRDFWIAAALTALRLVPGIVFVLFTLFGRGFGRGADRPLG